MRLRNPLSKQRGDVVLEAMNILFQYAVERGDRFRQAYYPDWPSYARSATMEDRVRELAQEGLSAQEIAEQVYEEYA
jgi:hypothetical protein